MYVLDSVIHQCVQLNFFIYLFIYHSFIYIELLRKRLKYRP